ncbi:DnaJ domain-containing protein [Sporodiniella umbellata]|nr:DnaJ domain-containing protein [Sporodiniella umbellata]
MLIPFAQHVNAASEIFQRYHGTGFFSVKLSNSSPPEKSFLPFWVVSATVRSTIEQAQVGQRRVTTHYNPKTKQNESKWETEWAWVPNKHNFERDYHPLGHSKLQVYASHRYRRGLVESMTTGPALENAVPFSPSVVNDEVCRIDPFKIYPHTALRLAKNYIQSNEEKLADEFLLKAYNMDETRFLKVNVELENVVVSPVYYPAYIFSVEYLGRTLRTFVNGQDLTVGGTKAYNWKRSAIVSATGMAATMMMTGGVGWGGMSGSFWLGIVLPTTAVSLLTLYYPLLSLYVRDLMQQYEMKSMSQDSAEWDEDWVKGYAAYEDQERRRTWRNEKANQSSWKAGTNDAKGHYRALNVSTTASQSEIQSAFRGLAMKYHPDRFSNQEEKSQAKVKFQTISAAYSVLRDPKKRRVYDQSGSD